MDVKTAGRTVSIFEAFAEAQKPLTLSEIGQALKAPLSSCLYLVRALENRGYLYSVGTRKHIYPTRKLSDIARSIAAGETWLERIEPVLLKLRDATRETVLLGKRQGDHVIYLAVYEGPQTIRYSSRVGDLKPLHSSAIGKAVLSALDPAERRKIVAKLPLQQVTRNTITNRDALLADLEKSASRGYSITCGENVADVMAMATVIESNGERFGMAIAGPTYRMKPAVATHAKNLMRALRAIEAGKPW